MKKFSQMTKKSTVVGNDYVPIIDSATNDVESMNKAALMSTIQNFVFSGGLNAFDLGTKVGNSGNLNDIKTPGKYYADSDQAITNAPISGGFAMLNIPAYNSARFAQVVLGLDGTISIRAMYLSRNEVYYWTDWWKSFEAKSLVGRKAITTATNFNTIVEIGDYSFPPGVASAANSNCPFSVGGRLTVEYSAGTDNPQFLRQTASKYSGADTYTRTTADGGSNWTHWYLYSSTDTGA